MAEQNLEECNDQFPNNILADTTKNLLKTPFRQRASTDGTIFSRPRKWQHPQQETTTSNSIYPARIERRMSISMRGNNGT